MVEAGHLCSQKDCVESDAKIFVFKNHGKWQLVLQDGIGIGTEIFYCPFCGAKLSERGK